MPEQSWTTQSEFDVRFEWGATGTKSIAPGTTVVVVDVLRFTTAVEAGTNGGAAIYPYRWRDESLHDFARSIGALLADGSDPAGPSLSPASLRGLGADDAIVLPSLEQGRPTVVRNGLVLTMDSVHGVVVGDA